MPDTNLDYQFCILCLFILGLLAALLLPTPDERRRGRRQRTHDTTKTRWLEDAATEREQDAHSLALDPEHR